MKERTCHRCKTASAVNVKGPPVCGTCRLRAPYERTRKSLACSRCGRRYVTTGGNLLCGSCRHHDAKHPCEDCGTAVDYRAEVCRPCWGKRHVGAESPVWKGGRSKTIQGYILVQCPDHPRAVNSAAGYVREHVLVMERLIGRFLLPGESVHHKNGVKGDNRPENLELWVKSQPAGQRASDLLAWAREIVERYECLPLV